MMFNFIQCAERETIYQNVICSHALRKGALNRFFNLNLRWMLDIFDKTYRNLLQK